MPEQKVSPEKSSDATGRGNELRRALDAMTLSPSATRPLTEAEKAMWSLKQVLEKGIEGTKEGVVLSGKAAEQPLLVNGKPVVVTIVGDRHTAEGEAGNIKFIPKVGAVSEATVLFLEGNSVDPNIQEQVRKRVEGKLLEIEALALSPEERAKLPFGYKEGQRGDYQPVETYSTHKAVTSGFKKVLGMESADGDVEYDRGMRVFHTAAVTKALEVIKRGGLVPIVVDGKPFDRTAVLITGAKSFPETMTYLEAVATDKEGKDRACFLLGAESAGDLEKYTESLNEQHQTQDLLLRNDVFAKNIRSKLQELGANRAVVVVGAAHLDKIAGAEYPQGTDIQGQLAAQGVSSVPVIERKIFDALGIRGGTAEIESMTQDLNLSGRSRSPLTPSKRDPSALELLTVPGRSSLSLPLLPPLRRALPGGVMRGPQQAPTRLPGVGGSVNIQSDVQTGDVSGDNVHIGEFSIDGKRVK